MKKLILLFFIISLQITNATNNLVLSNTSADINIIEISDVNLYEEFYNFKSFIRNPYNYQISNPPPTDILLSNTSINENEDANTVIGDLSATPSDLEVTYYFDVIDNTYDNDSFKIVDNQLLSNVPFDFEVKATYLIKLFARNSLGEKLSKEFTITVNDVENEGVTIIEITDTTLNNISYDSQSFSTPTKLIFTNLTTATGRISFSGATNLVAVEFPNLETTGPNTVIPLSSDVSFSNNTSLITVSMPKLKKIEGSLSFTGNNVLETVNLSNLETVYQFMSIRSNSALTSLAICNLKEILPGNVGFDPSYTISDNPVLNYDSTCLTNTVIVLNFTNTITLDENEKYLVATLSSNVGEGFYLEYFFIDDDGNPTANEDFEIVETKIYLTKEFEYYQGKEFLLNIGAYRYENTSASNGPSFARNSRTNNGNGLTEKIEKSFNLNLSGVTLDNVVDLTVTNLNIPLANLKQEQALTVNCTLNNLGTSVVAASTLTVYLVSTPNGLLDTQIGSFNVSNINAPDLENVSFTVNIPVNANLGSQYLVFFADATKSIIETDETNNLTTIPITIIDKNSSMPISNFTTNVISTTIGNSIIFTDQSTNNPTSWQWTFEGGTPNTSTQQNPEVTYITKGSFDVTLLVTNASGNTTETKKGYATITEIVSGSNVWTGATDTNWATTTNWSSGVLPTATDDVVISNVPNKPIIDASTIATTKNLAINESSSLIVEVGGALTVSGSFSSVEDHALALNSGSSILINSASTSKITYNRNIPTTNWYLVSSPVLGETIENVIANNTFATGATTAAGTNIGIGAYNNNLGTEFPWVYATATTSGYSVLPGLGISVKFATAGISKAQGLLSTNSVNTPITVGSRNSFNLIGNPFAAYLNLGDFFADNPITAVLSESSAYFWDGSSYQTKTSALDGNFEIAPTQGFFVSSGQPVTLATFDINDVSHQSTDTFLRGSDTREQIKLFISDEDNNSRYARIFYINGTTTGFDNGYDGSMFGGASESLAIYSHLLSDNQGIKYAVQSLPHSNHENMIVPMGVIAAAGKEITFSTEALNLPEGIKVFLEDRNTNTFTRLDETAASYKVALTQAINGVGRFYLHTIQSVLSIGDNEDLNNISIFTSDASTLKITGLQGRATLKLFTVLGKQVINSSFTSTGMKEISLPSLSKGVYVVELQTENGRLNKKIIL
jgi:PKD repeat protein